MTAPLDDRERSESIAGATVPGAVHLTVSDLGRAREFYDRVLGLKEVPATGPTDGDLALGVPGGSALLILHGDPGAPAHAPRAPGLFHFALLYPARGDLARALLRVAGARWPLTGASDHLVSEALYLSDPDGNGIELYRDRPREQWPHEASGELRMATLPLDLDDLVATAGETGGAAAPPERTRMGHVHLQVSDIPRAEAFYAGLLGFDVIIRSYPGALFVSAGGYHHHLGLNTWNSRGATPAAPGAVGLRSAEIVLPDRTELERVTSRLAAGGVTAHPTDDGDDAVTVADPFGTGLLLRTA